MGNGASFLGRLPHALVAGGSAVDDRKGDEEHRIIRSREEYELFLDRYPRYPRSVEGWTSPGSGRRPTRKLLSEALRKPIAQLTNSQGPGWVGFIITVEGDDGMTWSASAADEVVKACTRIPRHHLAPEPRVDGFPQIVELISKRRLIALAQKTEAVGPLRALSRRSTLTAVLALLVVGALAAVLQVSTKTLGGIGILVPICGALAFGLAFLSQEVSLPLKRSERSADEKRLLDALDKAAREHPQHWTALIERLSEELAVAKRDRAVIIDDFGRLDPLTRDTVCHYLKHRSQPADAQEVWVVFEDAGQASLSKEISLDRTGGRRSRRVRMELLRQTLLDEQAMSRLASEVGRPERVDFRRVKSIVGQDSDAVEEYTKLLEGQLGAQESDGRAYGPLELAYLLAVQHRTGAWTFREQELVSDLSSKRLSAHPEVLQVLLPDATLNRSEVDDAVQRLKLDLGRMLDTERLALDEIELVTEAADVLIESRGQYKLPAKDVVHLYWALYWYSKLVGAPDADAYRIRKLGQHLVWAARPGALEVGLGEEVERRFCEALIWTARALLAASLPDDVRTLLERAERETSSPEERARLRAVCWQAYAVLGDDDLLGLILRLHPGSTGVPPSVTDPEYLFVESLRFAGSTVRSRSELSSRLLSLDREISIYGQVRGLWLALTLDTVISGYWSRFTQISGDAADNTQALVRQALGLLDDPARPRASLAALSVSMGVWCFALGCLRRVGSLSEAIALLDDVRAQAEHLHRFLDDRRSRGESEDFVLRAFANEIEVVTGAAALVIARGRFDTHPSEEDFARLWDHAIAASGIEGRDQVDGIARRMTLQALTWRTLGSTNNKPLGFDQLATLMTLRRVHLTILVGGRRETVDEARSALAGQLDEPGPIGLIAHSLAMRRSASEEIRAHLWAQATALGLRSDFGRGLELELCLTAVSTAHAFHSVPKQEMASHLVAGGSAPERSAIGLRLGEFDDEDRPDLALWLLNTAEDDMPPSVMQALVAETRALRDDTEDPAARDEVSQIVELFDLNRDEEEGVEVDVTQTLRRWEDRRDSLHYAWMLHLLIRQPGNGPEAFEAALSYLKTHREPPKMSGPIVLAYDMARIGARNDAVVPSDCREVACGYLDELHPSIEPNLTIETNIDILSLLVQESVGDRDRHFQSLVAWETARQERDSMEKLPALVETGKFFHVLWHYCETLYFFGLRTEPIMDLDELRTTEGQARVLAQWRALGEPVPEPMLPTLSGVGVSADFIRFGLALFGEAAENPDLEDARERFNDESLDAMPKLFDQLRSLSHLPERISTLLAEHRAQLARAAADRARTA
jgi:hypothetical protein